MEYCFSDTLPSADVLDLYEARKRELESLHATMQDLFLQPDGGGGESNKTLALAATTKRLARVHDSLMYLEDELIDVLADAKPKF